MNEYRKKIVIQAFNKLDRDQDEIISVFLPCYFIYIYNTIIKIMDIKNVYNAKNHPDLRKGLRSEDEILAEFLETFE